MKKKIKFWKFWERPIYEIREYSFNLFENIVRFQLLQIKIQPACKVIRLKKNNFYVSKLVTDWKTWLKCGFLTFFSDQQTFQIWVGHNFVQYEIWNLIFGWTRYKTEHRVEKVCCLKCIIVSVISFDLYFDKQAHKKTRKKISKQKKKKKIKSLNFVE